MARYVNVLTEAATVDAALSGRSIARFGDGELRMALGGNCISQRADKRLQRELINLLEGPTESLVCVPNCLSPTPKFEKTWHRYLEKKYVRMMRQKSYGSAFITRPDSAPWINTPAYWNKVKGLWLDKEVTLVVGQEKTSIHEGHLLGAKLVRLIYGPQRDAYAEINAIEERIGRPDGVVLICLGATATVLAERLAFKGVHALDLGHMGRFMPKVGPKP